MIPIIDYQTGVSLDTPKRTPGMSKYRKKPVIVDAFQWNYKMMRHEYPEWFQEALAILSCGDILRLVCAEAITVNPPPGSGSEFV